MVGPVVDVTRAGTEGHTRTTGHENVAVVRERGPDGGSAWGLRYTEARELFRGRVNGG